MKNNLSKSSNFNEEKNLFYNLDKFLFILNANIISNSKINEVDKLCNIIENLINFGFLGEKDLKIYKKIYQILDIYIHLYLKIN